MFTKQHYKAIAEIIKKDTNSIRDLVFVPKAALVKDLADYFTKDNEHFDRAKFLEACKS